MDSTEKKQTRPTVRADGKKIRNLRIELGFSQEKLGALAGVNRRTVQRAERGELLSLDTIAFIAEALQTDPQSIRVKDEEPDDVCSTAEEESEPAVTFSSEQPNMSEETGDSNNLSLKRIIFLLFIILNSFYLTAPGISNEFYCGTYETRKSGERGFFKTNILCPVGGMITLPAQLLRNSLNHSNEFQ